VVLNNPLLYAADTSSADKVLFHNLISPILPLKYPSPLPSPSLNELAPILTGCVPVLSGSAPCDGGGDVVVKLLPT
jgi:hypothetical protein